LRMVSLEVWDAKPINDVNNIIIKIFSFIVYVMKMFGLYVNCF